MQKKQTNEPSSTIEQQNSNKSGGYFSNFSKAFWTANTVELLERLAYYAVFIVLTIYLSRIWGFTDAMAGVIAGVFSATLYFLPTFAGAFADKIGFRNALLLAFGLLTVGYISLAVFPTMLEGAGLVSYGAGSGKGALSETFENLGLVSFGRGTVFSGLTESPYQWLIVLSLAFLVVGGSFIKSVISGTVAKETTSDNRAKGFAIFYMMVNIGAFIGKTGVDPLRQSLGDLGLVYLNYMAGFMTLFALILVFFLYKSTKTEGEGKSVKEIWKAFLRVCSNGRLVALILITSGFWIVQQQMYASMPKYVIRMVGEGANPGWIANVNPLVVFIFVNIVTSFMKKRSALASITVGMFIIPISALVMSTGNLLGSEPILGLHPVTLMLIVGIALQALAECFISPRFLEYFSLQSPKGEEGLYLGFSHLHSFVSSLVAFVVSGFLLEKFCPDPTKEVFNAKGFFDQAMYAEATANAHYLWIVFFFVGLVAALALVIYSRYVNSVDKKVSEN